MEGLKSNYDKLILGIAAVVAVAIGAWVFLGASAFRSKFDQPIISEGTKLGETGVEDVAGAQNLVSNNQVWTTKEIDGKPIGILSSTPIVQKEDKIIDMQKEEPRLREEMTNAFLWENELDFLRNDVAQLDPDGDGFTNLDEFIGETNPKDKESHPPFYTKIVLRERIAESYILKFAADISGQQFQITRTEPVRASAILEMNGKFFANDRMPGEDNRFEIKQYFTRDILNESTQAVETLGHLVIHDSRLNQDHTLVLRRELDIPTYIADLGYELPGNTDIGKLKIGEEFALPQEPSNPYKVVDILEDKVIIAPVSDPNQKIERPKVARSNDDSVIPEAEAPEPTAPESAKGSDTGSATAPPPTSTVPPQ
ncbi:MAG: Amuc_1099 family pilus-like system protein [Verrucomicrobiales bacterium]